jgi:hypothetical protein
VRLRLARLYQESGQAAEAGPLIAAALQASTKEASRGQPTLSQKVRQATALLLAGKSAEARPLAGAVFATGFRRAPFVTLCAKNGITPPA